MEKNLFMALLCAINLFFPAFSLAETAKRQAYNFEEIKTETIDGVIVPESRAREFYSNNKVQGYFTPSKEDILKAESKVIDYIDDHTPQQVGYPFAPDLDKKLANYKRQYVGVILKNGKRKIWLNFFCNAGNDSWKSNPLSVMGGGACYFNLLYDIDTGVYSGLRINGVNVRIQSGSSQPVETTNKDRNPPKKK